MNQIQQIELDLLKEFIFVCEKLNLQYFLMCGSMLGTVKYKGFIPWDDDIDVALFRSDYEIFIREARNYLPERYFLQNYKTDPEFPSIYSKLRNSDTTFIEESAKRLDINHGIYIDIFPIDGYPQKRKDQIALELKKKYFKRILSSAYEPNATWKKYIVYPIRFLYGKKGIAKAVKEYEKVIMYYSTSDSDILCNHGNWQGQADYSPSIEFSNSIEAKFEEVNVRIPAGYDAYLKRKYGDYWADLPDDQRKSHHICTLIDCTQSYRTLKGGE